MTAIIKIFQVGEKSFKHVINTMSDSVELRNESDEILLSLSAEGRVTNQDGRMGNFYVEYFDGQPRWVYYEIPLQTRTVFGPDLPTAEVEVSKRFIGRSAPVAFEPALVVA